MGSFSLNGTFTYLPDPSAWEGITNEVGIATGGAPVLQGYEEMTLTWFALSQQQYGELKAKWAANRGSLVSGALPDTDDSSITWDTVTAYFHEPSGQLSHLAWRNVTMRVSRITRS